jgi:hypothetical protein
MLQRGVCLFWGGGGPLLQQGRGGGGRGVETLLYIMMQTTSYLALSCLLLCSMVCASRAKLMHVHLTKRECPASSVV